VTQTQGYKVTPEGRSSSIAKTIEPAPQPGTLSISYMYGGRWYVLRDDGSGALRGADSSYGGAQLNYTTGSVVGTLGALPDVGSQVIFQWVEPDAARDSDLIQLDANSRFYWPFNTSGVSATTPGTKTITPGAVAITWMDGATLRTVTDNGAGQLQGYGTGTVDYSAGVIRLSPATLPAPGTVINVGTTQSAKTTTTPTLATSGSTLLVNLGATGIIPGTVVIDATAQMTFKWFGETGSPPFLNLADRGQRRRRAAGALRQQHAAADRDHRLQRRHRRDQPGHRPFQQQRLHRAAAAGGLAGHRLRQHLSAEQ
jgi:hypothetical protein